MNRGATRFALVAFALAVTPRAAFALPETTTGAATAGTERSRVDVLVVSDRDSEADLEASLTELLTRLQLVPNVTRALREPNEAVSDDPTRLARVVVVLEANGSAEVRVSGPGGSQILRTKVRRDGPRSMANEEIAHVVQGGVEPILLAERDGKRSSNEPKKATPEPAPATEAPKAAVAEKVATPPPVATATGESHPAGPASEWAVDLTTHVGAALFSKTSGPTARLGGSVSIAHRTASKFRPSLVVAGYYLAPFVVGDPIASVDVRGGSARVLPTLGLFTSNVFGIDAALGGGFDVLSVLLNPTHSPRIASVWGARAPKSWQPAWHRYTWASRRARPSCSHSEPTSTFPRDAGSRLPARLGAPCSLRGT